MIKSGKPSGIRRLVCGACLASALAATGCQIQVGGQTLPSPYYLQDDIQYFAPGSEFPLAREAAAQRRIRAEFDELEAPPPPAGP